MWLPLMPSDRLFRLSWNLASLSAGTQQTLAGSAKATDKDSTISFNPSHSFLMRSAAMQEVLVSFASCVHNYGGFF